MEPEYPRVFVALGMHQFGLRILVSHDDFIKNNPKLGSAHQKDTLFFSNFLYTITRYFLYPLANIQVPLEDILRYHTSFIVTWVYQL